MSDCVTPPLPGLGVSNVAYTPTRRYEADAFAGRYEGTPNRIRPQEGLGDDGHGGLVRVIWVSNEEAMSAAAARELVKNTGLHAMLVRPDGSDRGYYLVFASDLGRVASTDLFQATSDYDGQGMRGQVVWVARDDGPQPTGLGVVAGIALGAATGGVGGIIMGALFGSVVEAAVGKASQSDDTADRVERSREALRRFGATGPAITNRCLLPAPQSSTGVSTRQG
jgi:hypothetical protein